MENVVVDLRSVESMQGVYVETLKQFKKIVAIKDATFAQVSFVIREHVRNRVTLLLFDNADHFMRDPGLDVESDLHFISFVKDILKNSTSHTIKIIITTQNHCDHTNASSLHQEQLLPLCDEDANSIIRDRMIHKEGKENDAVKGTVMEAIGLCRYIPLNLTILGGALQEEGNKLQHILPVIKRKLKELKQKEGCQLSEEDLCTFGILESRFEQLSEIVQQTAVALSLFTRSFTVDSASAIVKDNDKSVTRLVINHLKCMHFLNHEENIGYEMHSKVREFLMSKRCSSKEISEFYEKAKYNFLSYFKGCLINIARFIDDDYVKAYYLYMENSSDFQSIFNEKDNELILADDYDDNQNIFALLNGMLEPSRSLGLFQSWADISFKKGNYPFYSWLYSFFVMQNEKLR